VKAFRELYRSHLSNYVTTTEKSGGLIDHHSYYQIKTRDGVDLNTKVHFDSFFPGKKATVFEMTPYNEEGLNYEPWVENGFHYAGQDFRGRYASKGTYSFWEHTGEDAFDSYNFMAKQDWSNGHFFSVGGSADGIACYMQVNPVPSQLLGQFVIVGSPSMYQTVFQQGGFRQALIEGWLTGIGEQQFIPFVLTQEVYDIFWQEQDITEHWTNMIWPAVHYGGWFDIFQFSTVESFEGYMYHGGPGGKGNSFLFMDPFGHCSGDQRPYPGARDGFAVATAIAFELFKAASSEMSALESVRGVHNVTAEEKEGAMNRAVDIAERNVRTLLPSAAFDKINVYLMGSGDAGAPGNKWINFTTWPTVTPLLGYFGTNETITWNTPPTTATTLSYIFNSKNPVETLGGNNLVLKTCGSYDQRPVEDGRDDVLHFFSPPATAPMTFIGPVSATLYVSSNATDTDFTVKWLDVYPDGKQMLLQDGIVRMRWRDIAKAPPPIQASCIVPGKVYEISVSMQNVAFVLNKGHRIGVSVSSSNSPRFSANPNTCDPLNVSKPAVLAKNSLWISSTYPSHLVLPQTKGF